MSLKYALIDDEYLVRERLKHCIDWESEGFSLCGEAEDGQEGINLILDQNPALAIVDINMPLISGLEMAEALSEKDNDVEIVILSGYQNFEYARAAIQFRVFDYLLKPVKKEELLQVVRKVKKMKETSVLYCKSIEQAIRVIDRHFMNKNLSIDLIADFVGINPSYLSSKFKKETGRKLVDEINLRRLKEAEKILKKESCHLQELADRVGYNDPYYMSRCFKKYLGYSPSQLQR